MNNLTELLRDADPLQWEPPVSFEQRNLHRLAMLAAVSSTNQEPRHRSRVVGLVVAAVVLVAAVAGARMWTSLSPEVQAAVRFEVRLAEDKPAPGLRQVKVAGSQRSIYIHQEVVVSNGDIATARLSPVGKQYDVSVTFTKAGADKMRVATNGNIGKSLAILLDGQVVMVPVIRSPIDDSAVITGKLTKAQAEKIVNGVTKK